MKKSLIAVAGASLAAAAMPVVGVFAAESQLIDTVKVTISDSCTLVNKNDAPAPTGGDGGTSTEVINGTQVVKNTYAVTMALGQLKSGIGGPGADGGSGSSQNPSTTGGEVDIVCNGTVDPSIDPQAEGDGSWKITAEGSNGAKMIGAGTTPDNPHEIATGTATSGATSNWAFKIEGKSGANDYNGTYKNYTAIPSSATEIVRGKGAFTFKPRYQVYIGTSQAADTYTGTVTYTLTAPAA